jgi:large subunit ribosomal protein L21
MGYHKKVRIVFQRSLSVFLDCSDSEQGPPALEPKPNEKVLVMYAVIETGGKQYRVAPGQTIEVETLTGDVGSAVEFDRVLAISNDANEMVLGDVLKTARVRGTIAAHGRGDKIIVFKFKRKKQYKRTIGHRQNYTRVQVQEIVA